MSYGLIYIVEADNTDIDSPRELQLAEVSLGPMTYSEMYVGVQMTKMWSVHLSCWYPKASWEICVESQPN